ncbi:hypothetical protein EYC84_000078 [Monilinia fructicola]|uniref:Peptidase A1 domain-containing protein n=1 Tax=Monilinia fructicola TaxID=38448 RepID=A0A5M9JPU8_MONFR|nr:hypothetical protein EYC84_000078 [Monilinia fructicola]
MVGQGNEEIGQSIEVVVDYGSSDFWVFGPNATVNYGSQFLGFSGACNTTPDIYYHPDNASISNFTGSYSYGGNSKILQANQVVNDTLFFPSYLPGAPIPNIQVALVNYGEVRQYVPDGTPCPAISYDLGIMGLAPSDVSDTTGPNLKANLLAQNRITKPQASMFFSPPAANAPITSNRTGTLLLGALPPADSYTGDLVPVPLVIISEGVTGYYIAQPAVSHANASIPSDAPPTTCLIDSGSLAVTLPFGQNSTDFLARTGLQDDDYDIVYPSDCEDIPADLTLDFEIASAANGTEPKSVKVKVPYRDLARGSEGPGGVMPVGKCVLSLSLGDSCVFLGRRGSWARVWGLTMGREWFGLRRGSCDVR